MHHRNHVRYHHHPYSAPPPTDDLLVIISHGLSNLITKRAYLPGVATNSTPIALVMMVLPRYLIFINIVKPNEVVNKLCII